MSRSGRLFLLMDAMRAKRVPVTAAQLAQQLGVSERTIYRDIQTLAELGAPLQGEAGIGYVLRRGAFLPPLMFGPDELEALVLGARWVASHADPELAEAAGRALDRVVGVLPEGLRLQVETSGLFAPDWSPVPPEPWLPALRRAIRAGHAVRIHYRDAEDRASERVIWPFAMAFLDDRRLLAAWCELRGDFRHFRADRVLDLADAGERYPARRHALIRRWREATGDAVAPR